MTTPLLLILTPIVAFAITAGLMPLINQLALRTGFVDIPNARKIHSHPIPLLGGLGVYLGVVAAIGFLAPLDSRVIWMMAASLVVMIVGVIDDRFDLHSRYRLLLQVAVAAGLAAAGVRFSFFQIPLLDGVLTVFWMVGVINAINCIDCADGAAGATCLVAFTSIAVLSALIGRSFISQAALAGAGAIVGFMVYNAPPARVFLGDTGSTFLGLMLASLAVLAQPKHAGAFEIPLAPFFLMVPVADIIWVHARRYQAGIRSFRDLMASTGKDHIPHRLLAHGLTPVQLFWALTGLSLFASFVALGLTTGRVWLSAASLSVLAAATAWLEIRGHVILREEDGVSLFVVGPYTHTTASPLLSPSTPETRHPT